MTADTSFGSTIGALFENAEVSRVAMQPGDEEVGD
jgi:hypothetical protein